MMYKYARIKRVRNITVYDIACQCWARDFQYDLCCYLLIQHGFSPIQSLEEFQRVWNKLDQEYADFCNEHGCPADPIGFADVRI
ncbi:hypothetical protein [Pseudomonas phage PASB7]|uniref:Uncharacterized protein n=3 Tax=Litunavirus TaxID=1920762 RepID=A0A0A7NRF8_9CAUD|nr:hypothetical protein ACQ21_gp05 [Pseudomonas phage Pa2]AIZ94847.1 hypothetical protein [Pseudomonas phage Pa2]AIZ94938.1 hypothetical protein [Pseudomonas phage phi176]WNV46192.1 hypothetical protein [Pseudomonas phage PASB7]